MKNSHVSQSIKILVGVISVSAISFRIAAVAATFNFTSGLDSYTVPISRVYSIDTLGASAGNNGGLGDELAADFNLNAGEILTILD